MKPLDIIYWTRAGLGLVIGLLCGVYVYFAVSSEVTGLYTLLTGLSFAMLFYVATFYLVKMKFLGRVEKRQKLVTQGIGIYFFAWLVSWTLLVTLLMPSVSVNIYVGGTLAEGQQYWVAAYNNAGEAVQNLTTSTGSLKMNLLPPGAYTFKLGETGLNRSLTLVWLESKIVNFTLASVG